MAKLWAAMIAIYGHRWHSDRGSVPFDDHGQLTVAGRLWERQLRGLGDREIARGISASINTGDEWPPAVATFKLRCLGVPSLAAVKLEFRTRDAQRSPFVVLVWSMLDGVRYGAAIEKQADLLLQDAYLLAREHVLAGGALPVSMDVIAKEAPQKPVPASDAIVRVELAKVAQMLRAHDARMLDDGAGTSPESGH